MKIILILLLNLFFVSNAKATVEGFSIDQEYQIRKLSTYYSKKYGMKIKIKRDSGNLTVKVWDRAFYVQDWKITLGGARLVRNISHALCNQKTRCDILLKTHHALGDDSKAELLKKTQYKMSSVSLQILKNKISPSVLTQMSMGGSEPLSDPAGDSDYASDDTNELNTRTEITFFPKRSGI